MTNVIKEQIESTLNRLIPPEKEALFEMARYSMEGGKRLRPMLTLAVLEAFDIPLDLGLVPACAIEMVHTYSLIHDDLPCMDDDDFRRGKPTLHKAYPESHAVLTGDFLLTYAFEVIANAPQLTLDHKNQLIATLAHRAGSEGMIGGQILDIESQDHPIEPDALQTLQVKKTAALITCALEFGAIIAEVEIAPFQFIGEALGLSFQIIDDILDGDGAFLLFGDEKARGMAEHLYEQALSKVQALKCPAPHLEALVQEMVFRKV